MIKQLFDVFRMAMLNRPDGSRKEAFDCFLAEIKSDPAYLDLLARDYFDRMAAIWTVDRGEGTYLFRRTELGQKRVDRARQRRDAAERKEAAYSEMKASVRDVLLLDLTLPNGKVLRHSTGAECRKAGGFFAEVAKYLKPTQVVDRHLSEGDLQNIRSRVYQRNDRKRRIAG